MAQALVEHHVEIISTGGTYKALVEAGIPVKEVADYTKFPEMMAGRLKTLHPKIHGGILYRRGSQQDLADIKQHDILPIDLVVVNLYPFEKVSQKSDTTLDEAIENIDIGGPTMLRSAAKNHAEVAVLVGPDQYRHFIEEFRTYNGGVSGVTRRLLAKAVFDRTAEYDRAIAKYLGRAFEIDEQTQKSSRSTINLGDLLGENGQGGDEPYPEELKLEYSLLSKLRYGENPHQSGALYVDPFYSGPTVPKARQIHGKQLSYNNILDLDSALTMACSFAQPAAVIVKHNNPCGAALGETITQAFERAYQADAVSAFGSVVGLNRTVDLATAQMIATPDRFVEAIIAPSFNRDALEWLMTKPTWKNSVRLLETGDVSDARKIRAHQMINRPIEGGLLRQSSDEGLSGFEQARCVTNVSPTREQIRDLEFAWEMVRHVRSNAILLAKDEVTIGIGAGQMSRIDAAQIAFKKGAERCHGAVLASDAFFPFADTVELAAINNIKAIIQPGGSKRDQDSIDACNEHGIAMLFTSVRHFRH